MGRLTGAARSALLLASAVAFLMPGLLPAQGLPRAVVQQQSERAGELFNWYYASAYGTGVYKIGDETVGVLRLPFSYQLRKANDDQWGVRITLPVTAALAEFDLSNFQLGKTSVAGLSVLPGVEIEIPLAPNWALKPFINVGGGQEFQNDTTALIYSTGASTLYTRPLDNGWRSMLGGRLSFAGYRAGEEDSQLAALAGGGGVDIPIDLEIAGRRAFLGVQMTGTVYFNKLQFLLPGYDEKRVLAETEIALTLGISKPVDFFGVGFDRIGLGYRRGTDGLKGIRLVASFPF